MDLIKLWRSVGIENAAVGILIPNDLQALGGVIKEILFWVIKKSTRKNKATYLTNNKKGASL